MKPCYMLSLLRFTLQVVSAVQNERSDRSQDQGHMITEIWKETDHNHDGFIEDQEMDDFLDAAGVTTFAWEKYDQDKDGRLNKKEFAELHNALRSRYSEKYMAAVLDKASENEYNRQKELEQDEEIPPGQEVSMVSVEQSSKRQSATSNIVSFLESNLDAEALKIHWKTIDKDGDGVLNPREIEAFLRSNNVKRIDWGNYDDNGDDRLNKTEFLRVCQAIKDQRAKEDEDDAKKKADDDNYDQQLADLVDGQSDDNGVDVASDDNGSPASMATQAKGKKGDQDDEDYDHLLTKLEDENPGSFIAMGSTHEVDAGVHGKLQHDPAKVMRREDETSAQ